MYDSNLSSSRLDELNLLDIMFIFKHEWKYMLGIVLLITLFSMLITILLPQVYRAEVVLLPPLKSEIEMLNIYGKFEITPDDVYRDMISNLQSKFIQRQVFDRNNIYEALTDESPGNKADVDEIFINKFSEAIKISETFTNKNIVDKVIVSLDGPQSDKLVLWLNDYISITDKFTVRSLISAVNAKIEINISHITNNINLLKDTASKIKYDELVRLKEAAAIADQIGLEELAEVPFVLDIQNKNKNPDYLRGFKALRAEADALSNRKETDSFIPGLRELQGELLLLEKLLLDRDLPIHAARVDQAAFVLKKPIKPKRALIVIGGFIFGIISASIFVIIHFSFIKASKENIV